MQVGLFRCRGSLAASKWASLECMRVKTRKLVGSVILLVFLAAYVIVIVSVSQGRILGAAASVQFLFFLVAGLLWVLPAGLLIRWMQRPD
jgi:hypothetical protein